MLEEQGFKSDNETWLLSSVNQVAFQTLFQTWFWFQLVLRLFKFLLFLFEKVSAKNRLKLLCSFKHFLHIRFSLERGRASRFVSYGVLI